MSSKVVYEYSSGGVVIDGDKVLVIKSKNLKNETVYTFPKGHIEKGESIKEAAIREVEEETGFKCNIKCELKKVDYWFVRDKNKVHKQVYWFLMEPIEKPSTSSRKHSDEIEEILWVDVTKVKELLSYSSDKKLIELIIKENFYKR